MSDQQEQTATSQSSRRKLVPAIAMEASSSRLPHSSLSAITEQTRSGRTTAVMTLPKVGPAAVVIENLSLTPGD